jgi:hypothetical protein
MRIAVQTLGERTGSCQVLFKFDQASRKTTRKNGKVYAISARLLLIFKENIPKIGF